MRKISKNENEEKINFHIINESYFSERFIPDCTLDYFQSIRDLFKNKTISEIENILKQLIENNKYKLIHKTKIYYYRIKYKNLFFSLN